MTATNLYAEPGDTAAQANFRRDMAHLSNLSGDLNLMAFLRKLAADWTAMGGMEGAPAEFEALLARAGTETRVAAFGQIADRVTALWNGAEPAEDRRPEPAATTRAAKSTFVCQRCGLAVSLWRGKTWKHSAGSRVRSCGMPARVVEREAYERDMDEFVKGAAQAMRRFTGT